MEPKRYSLEELIADEDLFKTLIDKKKEDLQNQLVERQSKQRNRSDKDKGMTAVDNLSNHNANARIRVNMPQIETDRFKGGYCVESPSNTTIYASAGRILEERNKARAD